MERDEPRHECGERRQCVPKTLAAFWGNQLERIQKRAEQQAGSTSTVFKSDRRVQLDSDRGAGN
jgi:hypothetical protein